MKQLNISDIRDILSPLQNTIRYSDIRMYGQYCAHHSILQGQVNIVFNSHYILSYQFRYINVI